MREILFRGKDYRTKEWRYGGLIDFAGDGTYFLIVEPHPSASTFPMYVLMRDHAHFVVPKTIGQYTGLKDKNGKRIFEGDVVEQSWFDCVEPIDDSFGEVVYCENDCSFSVMDANKKEIVPLGRHHAYHWEVEIIGNIHDNPELLKEG